MAVVINEFEATAAAAEPLMSAAAAPTRLHLQDSQRALRQLAARAARLRAH